jgi:hypothetical protein
MSTVLLNVQKRIDEAVAAYEEAVRLDVKYAAALGGMAGIYKLCGKYEKCVPAVNRRDNGDCAPASFGKAA